MRTTTIDALRAAIETRVLALTPNSTELQGRPWRLVDDVNAVASGEVRTFYADLQDEGPVPGGIYSPAHIEHAATLELWTSYGNTKRRTHRALSANDRRQVWLDLAVRVDATTDNTIAGLVSIEPAGWQPEDDEQGRYWGAHVYQIRYLAPGIPGAS